MLLDTNRGKDFPHHFENILSPAQKDRFKQQIEFMLEIDKLKTILRKTILLDRSRRENSAEHSWHIALSVLIFSEYAEDPDVDLFRVMIILLVHDLVEIDAGDTYCHDDQGRKDQARREKKAADRIFNLLPSDQAATLRKLWEEFEERKTPESRYANALDRLQPFLHNYYTDGQIWQENNINNAQVKARMQPVDDGAPILWKYVSSLIDDGVKRGFLAE
jgi:putative hydrolase of HD superfamily